MCDCWSYNWGIGKKQPAVLSNPFTGSEVSIDPCIEKVIAHLWENGIATGGCCCGHNRLKPTIVLETDATPAEVYRIRQLIEQVDDRDFDIFAWRLTRV